MRSRLSSALGDEPEYIFKHVLTRDVAYDTLPRRDRSAAHASIARWLEDTLGERAREFLELLSYHWFEAYRACSSTDPQEIEALRLQAFDRTLRAAQETGRRYALKKSERLAGQAIDLAATPQERSLAYEASAEAFFNDYDGDEAWRGFTAAAEAELAPNPAIRSACPGCRRAPWRSRRDGPVRSGSPLRNRRCAGSSNSGSTTSRRATPANACSCWGPRHRGPSRSRRWTSPTRNWTASSSTAWRRRTWRSDWATPTSPRPRSIRRRPLPCAGAGTAEALEIEGRRLELLPRLRDQVEIGDVFAMMAWCSGEAGRWSDVVRYASEGERTVEVAINSRVAHPRLAGRRPVPHRRLGRGARACSPRSLALLGDRRDDPPYYVYNAFGSMALIHTFRGERAESDRLMDLLRRVEAAAGDTARRIWPYVNRLLVARGAVDEAWERFQHPPTGWRIAGACHLEAMCEWVPMADRWDRADDIVAEVERRPTRVTSWGFACSPTGSRGSALPRRRHRGRGRDPGARPRRVPRTRRDVGGGANRRRHRRGAQRHGARRRPAGPAGERRGPVRTSGVGGRAPSGTSGIIVLGRGRKRPAPMGRPRSIVVRGSIRLVWRERRRAASWRDGVRTPSRSR